MYGVNTDGFDDPVEMTLLDIGMIVAEFVALRGRIVANNRIER
jgi:hypothetical protein